METSDKRIERAVAFLTAHQAQKISHVNSTLLEHLKGTADLLADWGQSTDLCLAGLCHAIYGTDGFPLKFIEPTERSKLSGLIGDRAEEIVYFYCSCDRSYLYPQVGQGSQVKFRNRFNGEIFAPEASMFRDFLELTLANELELVRSNRALVNQTRETLAPFFARCEQFVSTAAFRCFVELYGLSRTKLAGEAKG